MPVSHAEMKEEETEKSVFRNFRQLSSFLLFHKRKKVRTNKFFLILHTMANAFNTSFDFAKKISSGRYFCTVCNVHNVVTLDQVI